MPPEETIMTNETTKDAANAQEILNRRDANGQPIFDQVAKDATTGQWTARRADDHTITDAITEPS